MSRYPIVFNFTHPLRDLFRFDTPSDFVKVDLIEPAKQFLALFQVGLTKFAETKRRSFTTHSYVKVSAISFERLRIINATDNMQLSDYHVKFFQNSDIVLELKVTMFPPSIAEAVASLDAQVAE